MLVSDFIFDVRLVLNDPTDPTHNPDQKWSDETILQHGTRQAQSLSRIQIERGKGFHNFTMVLAEALGVQVYRDCWQWRLPAWVSSVANVYLLQPGSSAAETTFSPYTWTGAEPVTPLQRLRKSHEGTPQGQGYTWDGMRTIRAWGFSVVPKLALDVAKCPPPLVKFTLDGVNASASKLYLPATLSAGRELIEEGIFINAELQVTSAPNIANFGALRRCVYSSSSVDLAGTRKRELTFDAAWPSGLLAGTTLESHLPVGDEHSRVLVLLTANACLQREGAIPIMKAIAPELSSQLQAFSQYAARKDHDGPDFINDANQVAASTSPDQAPTYWRGS